jgi:transposase
LHALNQPLAWREIELEKRSYGALLQRFGHVHALLGPVQESLREARPAEVPLYASIRAAIAEDALDQAEVFLQEGDWPHATALSEFAAMSCDSARALLTFAPLTPELARPGPVPSATSLRIRDGAFYTPASDPVFLFGFRDPDINPRTLALLDRYGLNFAAIDVSPADLLLEGGTNLDTVARVDTYLENADALGIGVTVGLAANVAPAWLRSGQTAMTPDGSEKTAVPGPGEARALSQRHLDAVAPLLQRHPSVNGVSLASAPAFHWETEEVRQGFQQAMALKYKEDRRAVNRAWRTRLRALDEIQILWDYHQPSYQYDWQTWHQHLVSNHFTWLAGCARRALPNLPLQIVLPGTAAQTGEARTGIDRQALVRLTDVTGCAASYAPGSSIYAVPFAGPELSFRLLRSLAPANPLVVSALTFDLSQIPAGARASQHVHAALWDAAIAGVNGFAARPSEFEQNPGGLEGFATACADLNRLGAIVTAFQRSPAPIAILWSAPSKIYLDGETFLESVQRVYEGSAFFGFPIRFITEEACISGGLADVSVLAMPEVPALADGTFQAINEYAKAGGAVIRSGRPAPYTPAGVSRHDVITQTSRTIFVRGSDTPTVYLHALDAAYVFGVLPPIPRTINSYGYPLEGVKSRYVELDGQEYLYVVNLRKEPARVNLYGGPRKGRDLVRGRSIQFPTVLEPLEPVLVHLAPVGSATPIPGDAPVLAENQGEPGPVVLSPVTP